MFHDSMARYLYHFRKIIAFYFRFENLLSISTFRLVRKFLQQKRYLSYLYVNSVLIYKMADKELQERILRFLNGKPKKTEAAAKIIQALRVPKKSLNNQLYKLQRDGRVIKVEESPPVWAVQSGTSVTALAPRTTRSRRKSENAEKNTEGDEELERKILEFLRGRSKPSKSLDIAKGTGHSRASDVNTTLYKMLEKGLIDKVSEKPPTWIATSGGAGARAIEFKPSANSYPEDSYPTDSYIVDSYPADNYLPGGQGIPVFQDTELFKTEPQFESEASEVYTTVQEKNEDDDSESENKKSSQRFIENEDEKDFETEHPERNIDGDNSSVTPGYREEDISTQGSYKMFEGYGDSSVSRNCADWNEAIEDDSLECDGEDHIKQEQGTGESMEMSSSGANSVNREGDQSGTVIGRTDNLAEESNELVSMEEDNGSTRNQLVHEAPEFDREYVKKPKTFRDVFRLDDPMSDDTSSSFDSAKEIDAELRTEDDSNDSRNVKDFAMCCSETDTSSENKDEKSTPEISAVSVERVTPEQTKVSREWNTPQILDEVLDLQEDLTGSAAETENPALGEGEDTEYGDSEAVENSQLPESSAVTEHALEAKDEISQVEMNDSFGKQVEENEEMADENDQDMKSNDIDMEDCDKVLKVLQELKGIAQFVLKRKTDIPPEHLDEVLQKCLSLNYVSGSSKLWKITDEGLDYISKKMGDNNIVKETEMYTLPERKVKPTFKGPPPSPMALLKKDERNVSGNSGMGDSVSKQTVRSSLSVFTSHSPNSLFKPPPAKISKTTSASVISAKSNSGPQSLMSIQFDSNTAKFAQKPGGINQGSVLGTPQPLMSVKFDSSPMNKTRNIPPQSGSNTNKVTDNQEKVTMVPMETNIQKLELNSNLWGTGANSNTMSSNVYNVNTKSQVSNSDFSANKLFPSSIQRSSPKEALGFQNSVNQRLSSPQNARKTALVTQEVQKREIPSKYADYPNQSTSLQCLKSKTQPKSVNKSVPSSQSKSAFNKGPPPSPLDILSKGLKKTEISPPSSYKDKISTSHPSGTFSTMSQTLSNRSSGSSSQSAENKSVFSSGQFSQSGSQNYFSGNKLEQTVTVNQSSFTQSGSVFANQSRQTSFQRPDLTMNQATVQSSAVRPATRGPPPPPAVKLGLQAPQSAPVPISISKPAQNTPRPNLGLALNTESFNALNKNPVSALMEYAQSRKLVARVEVISQRGSSHKPTFEMAAFVGNRKFPSVSCHNKKDGRKEACDIAMRQVVAEGQFQAENASAQNNTTTISPVPSANMTHFDTIAALTHRGFTALVSQITAESFAGRKVIAGLVMKRSAEDTGVLISLGTGNRCITGQQLSLQGNTVNDSHAEIITRRGFIRFLYKRLMEFDPSRPHPMFETSPRGKLQVRPNITFHLYISTAPCGDGALFSPRDAESSKAPIDSRVRPPHEPTFSSNVQGLLRTKVEGGEGTIPIEPGFKAQTFDGIQRGERLRTMSCTDKICRWNVVGMQGALLSHFLEPIYLDSLTLGLLYDHGHLCRAVCCRVGRGAVDVNSELPQGYRLNHPWLGRVTVCDPPREVQKTKALSINWCFGDKGPEVTDGTQGLCYTRCVVTDFV
ncbi:uncharacterized protein LOC123535826 [Mercenaria mercenaria]|uniref:uncharacterized protein LOC123535826 n=1 Tax=Mercenaria mercenaria TaxID=6596 RepID=UPI00234E96ED|nr:uncharacterized protein LOC123535826 [Mercenaria mercenaria]